MERVWRFQHCHTSASAVAGQRRETVFHSQCGFQALQAQATGQADRDDSHAFLQTQGRGGCNPTGFRCYGSTRRKIKTRNLLPRFDCASSSPPLQVTKRKRDIGEFSGWVFTDDEREKEEERASEFLSRFTNDALNDFLDILDLPRGADKKVSCFHLPCVVMRGTMWRAACAGS